MVDTKVHVARLETTILTDLNKSLNLLSIWRNECLYLSDYNVTVQLMLLFIS